MTTQHLALRGPTHNIWDFDVAREQSGSTQGTLQGEFRVDYADGSGIVGSLSDGTGFIQVFIPELTANYGPPNGLMEMDVVAVPQAGESAGSLPGLTLSEAMGLVSNPAWRQDWFDAFAEAARKLDVTLVATAIRPVG